MAWAPDYITVEQLKAYQRIGDTVDDVELASAITAASRAIDDHTNRQFGLVASAEQRWYTARPDYERGVWVVDIDDLMTVVGFEIEVVDAGAVAAYTLEPRNAAAKGQPWTRLAVESSTANAPTGLTDQVAITARWGWTAVPATVANACRLQANRFASRRDSPYGIAGSPDQGSELRLLTKLDPDVAVSLRGFVKPRAVA